MAERKIEVQYEVYEAISELSPEDAFLLKSAREQTANSYAPYSDFCVGATARLVNGELVNGTNQENASFPAGICAERVLMSTAASLYPGVGVKTIAISYLNKKGDSNHPISPCGICRQSFAEFQMRTGQTIRVILSGQTGPVYILENAMDLLPLSFKADDMK
ncbi:MAG: cytidine deaminase [Chitinophagaceae bacterium]|nr:cytidine deaminase [Chitinophagaceae bacterium]